MHSDRKKEVHDLHGRKLLSTDDWPDVGKNQDFFTSTSHGSTIQQNSLLHLTHIGNANTGHTKIPSEDEVFVSKWIADTKHKLLRYNNDIKESRKEWEERYGDWKPVVQPEDTSFLPWERRQEFQQYREVNKRREKQTQYETEPLLGRKLMDTFADSLLHVHRIYNRKFGYIARKVPAHMPHMIDVSIMNELQEMLPHEFDQTSAHKLRSSDDMQFAFSFMYFVMGQKKELNITKTFTEVDTDHSGTLSDRELRILATRMFPLPLSLDTLKSFERILINCSLNLTYIRKHTSGLPTEKYYVADMPLVTRDFLANCDPIIKLLNDSYKTLTKYKFETLGDEEVAFKMIRDNATAVMQQLDNIRGKRKKFVCLNDNIAHGTKEAGIIKALLVDFYESLFPVPSQFELGREYRNRFLFMDELNEYMREKALVQKWTNIVISVCIVVVAVLLFPNKVIGIIRKVCPFRRRFGFGSARLLTV